MKLGYLGIFIMVIKCRLGKKHFFSVEQDCFWLFSIVFIGNSFHFYSLIHSFIVLIIIHLDIPMLIV